MWGEPIQRVFTKSKLENRRFFNQISSHYHERIRKRRSLPWMRSVVEPLMGEKILDVGNGGVREFFSPRTSFYTGVDSSLEMLKRGKGSQIQLVCGEATNLAFKESSFDTIFYRSLLHHLAEKNVKRSMRSVKTALREGSNCLKKGGNIIVIEPCLPILLERIERFLFLFLKTFFAMTRQSVVLLFSVDTLTQALYESGFREIMIWKESIGEKSAWEWMTPLIGLPFLKIPRWLNISRRIIFKGMK